MSASIQRLIETRARDIGSFTVRRSLPAAGHRMVGPFIFFDHMGPANYKPGEGIDVRPHPHTCLATVTYLFAGEIVHRDSLGMEQPIRPGDVNWMTAGRGIVHSERTGPELRAQGHVLHGIQSWVALPIEDEEIEPDFKHHPAATLPEIDEGGAAMRLIAGTAYGETSPVATHSEMFYLDARLAPGARVPLPEEHEDRAVYVAEGKATVAGEVVAEGTLAIVGPGAAAVEADAEARVMLLGGEPLEGERLVYWNFVASSQDRIERAKADWKEGRFPTIPGDDQEFIPLPDD